MTEMKHIKNTECYYSFICNFYYNNFIPDFKKNNIKIFINSFVQQFTKKIGIERQRDGSMEAERQVKGLMVCHPALDAGSRCCRPKL